VTEWSDGEAAWWAKLRRARAHISDVRQRVSDFEATHPWSVEDFAGEAPNERGYRLLVSAPVPADLVTVLGDAIHNLRSAMDSVAYELAVRHVGTILTDDQERATEFPITKDPEEFEAFFTKNRFRPGLYGEAERAALRCVQPFAITEEGRALGVDMQTTDEVEFVQNELTRVHRLSNIDKHRRLPRLSWFPDLVYWTQPPSGATYHWRPGVAAGETFVDGTVLGYLTDPNGDAPPESEVFHKMHLTLMDDPFRRDLESTLEAWLGYFGNWVLPRMMAVAEGAAPPFFIGRGPSTPPIDA
jgi:hypothetical protein